MTRTLMTLALMSLAANSARTNPPVDETKTGGCLELELDGGPTPCNHDFRLVDSAVSFVTGYGDGRIAPKTVLALFSVQTSDMENAYGYALRLNQRDADDLRPAGRAADVEGHRSVHYGQAEPCTGRRSSGPAGHRRDVLGRLDRPGRAGPQDRLEVRVLTGVP